MTDTTTAPAKPQTDSAAVNRKRITDTLRKLDNVFFHTIAPNGKTGDRVLEGASEARLALSRIASTFPAEDRKGLTVTVFSAEGSKVLPLSPASVDLMEAQDAARSALPGKLREATTARVIAAMPHLSAGDTSKVVDLIFCLDDPEVATQRDVLMALRGAAK